MRWAVQTVVDSGTYVAYQVAPAVQGTTGVQNFVFETTTATPVTHQHNVDWFLTNPPPSISVKGLYSVTGIANLIEDDNAYGVDIELQAASVSTHWDVVTYSGD